jgi:hypothetical protein
MLLEKALIHSQTEEKKGTEKELYLVFLHPQYMKFNR